MIAPVRVRAWAPGRVNLIGEHTDHCGGLALPMAIHLGTTIEGVRGGDRVVLRSAEEPSVASVALDVEDAAAVEPAWARYVAGVVTELRPAVGLEGTVSTTVPLGGGLSSSAALEVAVALALGALDGGDRPGRRREVALACQRGEQRASGVPCGVMDQLASLLGVDGHALLVDFDSLTWEPVAVPDGLDVVVVDSGERRRLARSAYARRRAELARAEDVVGPVRSAPMAALAAIADEVVRRRARHVVSENQRVLAFADALGHDDWRLAGEILLAGHASLRHDFESTTPGIDALVAALAARPGVHGARLTGGGWGGCVVALADPGVLDGDGLVVRPSAGAEVTSGRATRPS